MTRIDRDSFDEMWARRTTRRAPPPLTDEEIDRLQVAFHLEIRGRYRDFLRYVGNTEDIEFDSVEVNIRRVWRSNSMIRESFVEDRGLHFPPNRLVMAASQGVSLAVLDLESLDVFHLDAVGDEAEFSLMCGLDEEIERIFSIPGPER